MINFMRWKTLNPVKTAIQRKVVHVKNRRETFLMISYIFIIKSKINTYLLFDYELYLAH